MRHEVFDVKAAELIVLSYLPVGSDDSGNEAHRKGIHQVKRVHTGLEQGVKDLIICRQLGQDAATEGPAGLGLGIMVAVPALITAETLVRPAISDPVSAMKTYRNSPHVFLLISHLIDFQSKMTYITETGNSLMKKFLFL